MASDVQSVMRQIELSYLAAKRALNSSAITAPHEFIKARMREMDAYYGVLENILGIETSYDIVTDVMRLAETKYELEQLKEETKVYHD